MPLRYSGNKKLRYERAVDEYQAFGLSEKDFTVKMFIKKERFDPLSKVNPDPRAIQFRGAKFCVALAAYLQPIEHKIYGVDYFGRGVPPSRNIVKGLNSAQRAMLLVEKARHFRDPRFIGFDASRFDKHVSLELLRLEHSVYLFFNPDPYFAWLLSKQLINVGLSGKGLKYVVQGRRMSGDMNTAVGNCLIMLMVLHSYLVALGVEKWDIIDDGDDSVVIVEAERADLLVEHAESMTRYGMTMKVECVTADIHQIDFCQSRIIQYDYGRYKFVRNWTRVLSRSLSGCRHWENTMYRRRTLRAIGACELALNLGVPVLQEFAVMLMRCCPEEAIHIDRANNYLQYITRKELRALGVSIDDIKAQPVTAIARDTFAAAFGIDHVEQMRLEARLRSMDINQDGMRFAEELDVDTWMVNTDHANVVDL